MGMLNSSSEAVVVTEHRMAIKTRSANIRRIPESERWDADKILGIRAVPWSPDGSDNAFDIQVGMERPAEMVPRPSWRSADGGRRIEGLLKGDPMGVCTTGCGRREDQSCAG